MTENEEKFKTAWRTFLKTDSNFDWHRWDNLKEVMFAEGKTSTDIIDLMDLAEAEGEL